MTKRRAEYFGDFLKQESSKFEVQDPTMFNKQWHPPKQGTLSVFHSLFSQAQQSSRAQTWLKRTAGTPWWLNATSRTGHYNWTAWRRSRDAHRAPAGAWTSNSLSTSAACPSLRSCHPGWISARASRDASQRWDLDWMKWIRLGWVEQTCWRLVPGKLGIGMDYIWLGWIRLYWVGLDLIELDLFGFELEWIGLKW